MNFTRHLITLLALTSVTAAIAGENRWFAGKYRPAAMSSASVTAVCDGDNRWFAGKYRPAATSCHMACCQDQHTDPKKT